MARRWVIVAVTALALVAVPAVVGLRPVRDSVVSAGELATRIQASAETGWSGRVRTAGSLQIPESDSFATLGELLGETTDLRVWWRTPQEWRVDRLRPTGETGLFRNRSQVIRWVFEAATATLSPVSTIRLPDASDLLPPTLARSMLDGARPAELERLPARRVAGRAAAGLRLTPDQAASTIGRVDIWADEASGLPLRVELYGRDDARPVLTTDVRDLTLEPPASRLTTFHPARAVSLAFDQSVDVAAAADADARFDLPATLAGLAARDDTDPGAVGVYGRGPTRLIALPLRGRVSEPLRERLRAGTSARETSRGTAAAVGPVQIVLTPPGYRGASFLLAGSVTPDTLQRAAAELTARR